MSARGQERFTTRFVLWFCLILGVNAHAAPEIPRQLADHGSGTLVLHHPDGAADALVLDASMDLEVQGLLANLTLEQTFRNTSDQWLNGRYLFPLPEDAAIRGMRITIGERIIRSEVAPRAQARANYEQAASVGQIASLMEQQRPNLFTMQVANIAPHARVKVTLDVMLPVRMSGQQLSLILPTTLTPRYLNAQSGNAQALQSDFTPADQADGPVLDVSLRIEALQNSSLVTANAALLQTASGQWQIDDMPMNRDLHIRWPAQHDLKTPLSAFVNEYKGERYVQLLAIPPMQTEAAGEQARELIVVLDKSGSMAGVSMRAAIQALERAIDSLNEKDLLNIVAFDDQHHPLFRQSLAATESTKREARRFAARLQADGGTEMASALAFALTDTKREAVDSDDASQRLKQIVFITDGSVGNEEALLRSIRRDLHDSRLFTVGIGSAPNRWFLEKAAEAGRGTSVSIQDQHDVADTISELLNSLRSPVMTDIAISYPDGDGEIYPRPVPDLYANRPTMWVGKLSELTDTLVISGMHGDTPFKQTIDLPSPDSTAYGATLSSAPAVTMHWTRQKISALEDEQRYASDPEMNRQEITRLAIESGLVTRYTSLIAREEVPSRPADAALANAAIANRLPQGNMMTGITLPQGAAGVDTLLWISLFTSIAGLALRAASRRSTQA